MPNTKINEAFIDIQSKINLIFDFTNYKWFAYALPEVLLTVEPDKNKGSVAGFFQGKTLYKFKDESIGQINISAEYLSHTWLEIAECILHEAIHLFCRINGNPAKSNYHDVAFKEACEAHGLLVEKVKNGWAKTSLRDDTRKIFKDFLSNNGFEEKPLIYRELPLPKPPTQEKDYIPKRIIQRCSICGISISTPYPKPFEESFTCPKCKLPLVELPIRQRT